MTDDKQAEAPQKAEPKRAGTILQRIALAVSEQNWFAVVIEMIIVVVGVVIGFQITTWGQERQDAIRERDYLQQLHADLVTSEEGLENIIEFFERRALAAAGIVHSFWQDDPPPRDSLTVWMLRPLSNRRYRPSLGTAKAIVSTGDVRLVSDDSLGTAIVTYIESVEADLEDVRRFDETYYRFARNLMPPEFNTFSLRAAWDSTRATARVVTVGPMSAVPQEYDRVPFPMEFDTMMNDHRVFRVYNNFLISHRNMSYRYTSMLRNTQELRALVEKVLER